MTTGRINQVLPEGTRCREPTYVDVIKNHATLWNHIVDQIFVRIATRNSARTPEIPLGKTQKSSHQISTKQTIAGMLISCVVPYAERTSTNSHWAAERQVSPMLTTTGLTVGTINSCRPLSNSTSPALSQSLSSNLYNGSSFQLPNSLLLCYLELITTSILPIVRPPKFLSVGPNHLGCYVWDLCDSGPCLRSIMCLML